jgi:hypothetical protein
LGSSYHIMKGSLAKEHTGCGDISTLIDVLVNQSEEDKCIQTYDVSFK